MLVITVTIFAFFLILAGKPEYLKQWLSPLVQQFETDSLPKGIYNPYNACYINAIIQLLYAIPEVRNYFISRPSSDLSLADPSFDLSLADIPLADISSVKTTLAKKLSLADISLVNNTALAGMSLADISSVNKALAGMSLADISSVNTILANMSLADIISKIFIILNTPVVRNKDKNHKDKNQIEWYKYGICEKLNHGGSNDNGDFSIWKQHDAQELLTYLFDALKKSGAQDIVDRFSFSFVGILHDREDPTNQKITTQAGFTMLPLNLRPSLEEMLEDFSRLSPMPPETEINGLKVKNPAVFTRIQNPPSFLVIHIKRFEYNEATRKTQKKGDPTNVPNKFSLPREMIHPSSLPREMIHPLSTAQVKYELIGGVEHRGKDSSHGHYITYTKFKEVEEEEDLKYIEFNDIKVHSISQKNMLDALKRAYLLVYKRTNN